MSLMQTTPQASFHVVHRSIVPQRQYPHVMSVIASSKRDKLFEEYIGKRDFGISYLPQEKADEIAALFRKNFQGYDFNKHFGVKNLIVSETDRRQCRIDSKCTVLLLHPTQNLPMSDSRIAHVFKLDHGLTGDFLRDINFKLNEDFKFSLKKGTLTMDQHKAMDEQFITQAVPKFLSNVDYTQSSMTAAGARHALRQISHQLIIAGIINDLEKESGYTMPVVLKKLIEDKGKSFLKTPNATLLLRVIEASQANNFSQEEFNRHIGNYYGARKEDSLNLDPRKAKEETPVVQAAPVQLELNIQFKKILEELLPPESKIRKSQSWDKLQHLIARVSEGDSELVRQILSEKKDYDNHTELVQDIRSVRRSKEDETVIIPEVKSQTVGTTEKKVIRREPLFLEEYNQSIAKIHKSSDLYVAIERKIEGLLTTRDTRAQDTKKIKGYDDLFELRVRSPEEYRIYFTFHDSKIVFLHSGYKGTQESNDLIKADTIRRKI